MARRSGQSPRRGLLSTTSLTARVDALAAPLTAAAQRNPDPTPAPGGCTAAYTRTGQWSGGFRAEAKVTAGAAAVSRR